MPKLENAALFGQTSFAAYGVTSADVAADDALEAMLQDESIQVIHATTPLNFTRRHKIHRSNLRFNFHNNLVTAKGVQAAPHNDPFSAIFYFGGKKDEEKTEIVLKEAIGQQFDIFEVGASQKFPLYSWWQVRCNNISGREEREIDKMIMITEHIDDTHVRFNYKMGWHLEAGRRMEYTRINPIQNIRVRNMRFEGNFGGEENGAHPFAFEYAVDCDTENIQAMHTYWPVILRRHNTGYKTARCSLVNPVEVVVGGTGYLTQQINCLYGSVRDCTTSNARHLNDFTGSAYCQVENCHGDGDFHGAFVTHGQFEHDLSYTGNSGLLSFANSGPTWGSSARRINVTRHVGCWGLAFVKVSELTLQDVSVFKTEKYDECGTLLLNVDGLQISGCEADKLVLTQCSARACRPNIVQNCYFAQGIEIASDGDTAVKAHVKFSNNRTKA